MSAMVISSMERFTAMSKRLKSIGVSTAHFFDTECKGPSVPMLALVPFVDFVILGADARRFKRLDSIVSEARARKVPVINEDSIKTRVEFP